LPAFFAIEGAEQDIPISLRSVLECSGNLDEYRDATRVIIGAIVDPTVEHAEMVMMGT
jgi:hypothetical protein